MIRNKGDSCKIIYFWSVQSINSYCTSCWHQWVAYCNPDVVIKLLHETLRLPLLKKYIFPSLKHCSKLSQLHYILTFEDIDRESVLKYIAKSRADSKSYSHEWLNKVKKRKWNVLLRRLMQHGTIVPGQSPPTILWTKCPADN